MLNETKEKVFYGFNYDKMFKAIFVGEDKKKNRFVMRTSR